MGEKAQALNAEFLIANYWLLVAGCCKITLSHSLKVSNPIRVILALLILTCILALFLAPGVSAAMAVQLNGGKQVVRVLTVVWLAALVSAIYRGVFRPTALEFYPFRQIYVHGFGPALLDKTCARLC